MFLNVLGLEEQAPSSCKLILGCMEHYSPIADGFLVSWHFAELWTLMCLDGTGYGVWYGNIIRDASPVPYYIRSTVKAFTRSNSLNTALQNQHKVINLSTTAAITEILGQSTDQCPHLKLTSRMNKNSHDLDPSGA